MADVAQRLLAAQRRVVWLAHRQEVRRQVARHHLAGVDEDVDGEEAEGVDACGGRGGGVNRRGEIGLDGCWLLQHESVDVVWLAVTEVFPIKLFFPLICVCDSVNGFWF